MQAGFAMLCAGSVRLKNVQNTMLKNLLDACGAALGFWSFGYAFAYGQYDFVYYNFNQDEEIIFIDKTTFIGNEYFFLRAYDNYAVWLFQFAFAATSATIVAGTLAERSQMAAYLCYSFVLTGFVYPVVVHAFWSVEGFLNPFNQSSLFGTGVLDFAGAGVVHVTGGVTAIIAVSILGPRKGRFTDAYTGEDIPNPKRVKGHSVSLQVLGTFILWFGWYGFNMGSTFSISSSKAGAVASLAGVCTTLAGASGCVTSMLWSTYKNERITGETTFELIYALNGCLSGLVSITGICAYVESWAAVVIGAISGLIYCFSSDLLVKLKIDDAVDAIPVHLFNGLWGVVCIGLFASPDKLEIVYGSDHKLATDNYGLIYGGGGMLLGSQLVGLLFIIGWVASIMLPFFLLLSYVGWLRSDPLEEIVGLDISYHGRSAYNMDMDYCWDEAQNHLDAAKSKGELTHPTSCLTHHTPGYTSNEEIYDHEDVEDIEEVDIESSGSKERETDLKEIKDIWD